MRFLSKLLFLTIIILAGCSSLEPKTPNEPIHYRASATFSMDYTGKPATLPPETWTEFYDAGTYLYGKGKYEKAMEYFLNAADMSSGEARRTCLVAAAVSSLAASDSAQFLIIRQEIRYLSEDDPFNEPTVTDQAIEALEKIDRY